MHLGPGGDRGRDLVVETRLRPAPEERCKLIIECKYRSRSLDRGDVDGAVSWAAAHRPDALIIATNGRIGADAFDWLIGTSSNRPFATIIWDESFFKHAKDALILQENSTTADALIDSVHSDIHHRISEHRRIRADGVYDSRRDESYAPYEPPSPRYFVDREKEVAILEDFSAYRSAVVVAPPGFGKSMLVSKILHAARQQNYSVLPVSFDSLCRDIGTFVLRLAKCLAVDHHDRRLLDHIRRHGWKDVEETTREAGASIAGNTAYIAIDNINVADANNAGAMTLVRGLATYAGTSRVLVTSRMPQPSLSLVSDISIELQGFDGAAVDALFRERGVRRVPDALRRYLVRERSGWPLLVTLASAAMVTSKTTGIVAERVEREAIQVITSGLSDRAKKLIGTLAALHLDIPSDELQHVLDTSGSDLERTWSEVELAGLARRDVLTSHAVNENLRRPLREIISKPSSVDSYLARWFAKFVDNVDRVSAAIDHYLEANSYEEAAVLLSDRGELLIRTGRADAVLNFVTRTPPEKLTPATHLNVTIVLARALSFLGRPAEALTTLRTWSFEMAYAPALAPAYRLEMARQLYLIGELNECETDAMTVIELPETDDRTIGAAWSLIGRVRFARRDLMEAEAAYAHARSAFESAGDVFGANKVRYRSALVALKRGDTGAAKSLMLRVLVESRRMEDRKREAYALHRLGLIAAKEGDHNEALRLLEESIAIKRRSGHVRGVVFSYYELAQIAADQGHTEDASSLARKARRLAEEGGLRKEAAMAAALLAVLAKGRGHIADAERWLSEAIKAFAELGLDKRAADTKRRYERTGTPLA